VGKLFFGEHILFTTLFEHIIFDSIPTYTYFPDELKHGTGEKHG